MNFYFDAVIIFITAIISFIVGILYRKHRAEKIINSAETESKRILKSTTALAEATKNQAILEGKYAVHKFKDSAEKEIAEKKREVNHHEKQLQQKNDNLEKKSEALEKKETELFSKQKIIDEKLKEASKIKKNQFEILEKISGFSINQAKDYLLSTLQDELNREKSLKILAHEQSLKEICEEKAKNILSLAIQRCNTDSVSHTMISVVPLPNDEMKGRIIGREGRNIKAIENLTGVDLIIDDTPEAITLSCFDPVRREIAKITLEYLIIDGRIHPSKIEEMVEKSRAYVVKSIKDAAQKAVLTAKINNIHPELVKLLGRLKFRMSYGQNVLNHSVEVSNICGMVAAELGLNQSIARRCGLLHDIGKAMDHEVEGSHVSIGVDIAKKYKESEIVINAIHSHHNDVDPKSEIAVILQAVDAVSAARPGARRENLENYIKRLEKLEAVVSEFSGVESCYAIQAGREIRVMIRPEVVNDERMIPYARNICKKIENDLTYPGQVKINLIRESRAVEYAK